MFLEFAFGSDEFSLFQRERVGVRESG